MSGTYKIRDQMVPISGKPISVEKFLETVPAAASQKITAGVIKHTEGSGRTLLVADGSPLILTFYGVDIVQNRLPMPKEIPDTIRRVFNNPDNPDKPIPVHIVDATIESKKRKMLASLASGGQFLPERVEGDEIAFAAGVVTTEMNEAKLRRQTPAMWGTSTEKEVSKEAPVSAPEHRMK